MRRETPMQWVPVLEGAGLHSARDLSRELEVSVSTATRLLHGEQTSRETIEAAATLLGITPEKVQELRGETALPPFRLPPEADRLSPRQRAAIVAVVRAMLETDDAPTTTRAATAAQEKRRLEAEVQRIGRGIIDAALDTPTVTSLPKKRRPRKGGGDLS